MNNTTIVTAFFDIHRGEWKDSRLSNNDYIKHFESWARLKNDLIVYTDEKTAQEVYKIRKKYGLENSTSVVVVDNYLELDESLYQSIKSAMEAPHAQRFHLKPGHPESWNPVYNYVMLLKWWCALDAIKNHSVRDNIAWIDFGFNKSGKY